MLVSIYILYIETKIFVLLKIFLTWENIINSFFFLYKDGPFETSKI